MSARLALWVPVLMSGCVGEEGDKRDRNETSPSTTATTTATGTVTTTPEVQTDRATQPPPEDIDVLWVVDDSCSMTAEQAALVYLAPTVVAYFDFRGIDYHLGVVTTDMDAPDAQGQLRESAGVRWIDPTTPDPQTAFAAMVRAGTGGSANERGLDAAYAAIEVQGSGYNAGFRRASASLHVIVLSDESDASVNTTVIDITDWMATQGGAEGPATFSALVKFPTAIGAGCTMVADGTPGDSYLAVSDAVGGVGWNLCDSDWVLALEQIPFFAPPHQEFFLSQTPVPETIVVWQELGPDRVDFAPGVDWMYQSAANSIVFLTYAPPVGADVVIEYEVAAAP